MKKMIIFCGIVVSGCSTVGEVRSQAPIVTVFSERSVPEIAGCISEIWSGHKGATVSAIPIARGTAVSTGWQMYSSPMTAAVADVTDEGTARKVTIRTGRKNIKEAGIIATREEIRPCL